MPEYYGNNDFRDYRSLRHWKYIKKERKNGKWKYYYHDDEYEDSRKKFSDAWKTKDETKAVAKSYTDFVSYYQHQLDEKYGDKQLTDKDKNLQGWKEMRDEAIDKYTEASRDLDRARKQYKYVAEKYAKSYGHKVADLLNSASDAINKGKSWVKKLLTRNK